MRPPIIAGILLLVLGGIVLLRGLNYPSTHDVVRVGDVHLTDTDSTRIPQWVGIAGVVAGIALVGAGATKRS